MNGDDPDIGAIVDDIVQNTMKRREFEQKQDLMLREDADTLQESVSEQIFLAAINWYVGLRFVASEGRVGVKWLLKSFELIDMCRGMVEHAIWQQIEVEKKEQATHGGNAKAALYASLKAEVIRLLYCNRPHDGWKTKKEALKSVGENIDIFIQEHGYPGFSEKKKEDQADLFSRIPRLIEDWSRDDAIIKAAFNATANQNKLRPLKAQNK